MTYSDQISFHKFPKDQNLRKQWIIRIRRDEGPFFHIKDSTVVYSQHFKTEDFKWTQVKKTLKKGSIPTVFNWIENRTPRCVLERKQLAPRTKDRHYFTLKIPHFLSSKRQFSMQESEDIENKAKLRIHTERMNRRIKENHLFDTPIPISWCGCINQLWTVACILALFKGPIVESWGKV